MRGTFKLTRNSTNRLATKLIDLTRQEFKLQQSTLQVEGLKEKLEARMEALKMDLKTLQRYRHIA